MDVVDLLSVPIIGAIIGCFTNWLAIKMLFRPYFEKRIFGLRLPFTPGMIPKRRFILAKKVGETVSEHILTKEALSDELASKEYLINIKKSMDDIFENINTTDKTVDDVLLMLFNEKKDEFIISFSKIFQNGISASMKSQYFKDEIANLIIKKFENYLKDENFINIIINFLEKHRELVINKSNMFLQSLLVKDFASENISNLIDVLTEKDEPLSNYVPGGAVSYLKEITTKITPSLSSKIQSFLKHNPETDDTLNNIVQHIVNDNINKVALLFVNKDKIYSSVKQEMFNYLESPMNQKMINSKVSLLIDNLLDKDIKDLANKIPKDFDFKDKIQGLTEKMITENSVEMILDILIGNIKKAEFLNMYETLCKYLPGFESKLKIVLNENMSKFIDEKLVFTVDILTEKYINIFLYKKVNTFFKDAPPSQIDNFKKYILEIIEFVFLKGATFMSKSLNISKIVEEQINNFELEIAEKIIYSVVNKELSVITLLGGLLGFLIGILTVFFQNI